MIRKRTKQPADRKSYLYLLCAFPIASLKWARGDINNGKYRKCIVDNARVLQRKAGELV